MVHLQAHLLNLHFLLLLGQVARWVLLIRQVLLGCLLLQGWRCCQPRIVELFQMKRLIGLHDGLKSHARWEASLLRLRLDQAIRE